MLTLLTFSNLTQSDLSSPAIWLEPFQNGVLALLDNGELIHRVEDTQTSYGTGWRGDSVLVCGGHIYGNLEGRIARPDTELYGPAIAPHHRPACLGKTLVVLSEDASTLLLLSAALTELARAPVNALPDAEIILADVMADEQHEIILLTDPTGRYAHGVLGDQVEAASVHVFDGRTLEPVASYSLPEPFVMEQRRVTPFDLEGDDGLLITRSSDQRGAGVVLLGVEDGNILVMAEAEPIGQGFRWLNLFASRDGSAYAVRTPHIGGPLERYRLKGDRLDIEGYDLGLTNHVLGARNLDLGVLLPPLEPAADYLVLPTQHLRALRLIRCATTCEVVDELELGARLSSNLAVIQNDEAIKVIAAAGTKLVTWTLEPSQAQ